MAWKQYLESTGTEEMVTNEMEKDIERLGIIADRFQKIGSSPNLKSADLQEVVLRAIHYMQPRISPQVELIPPTSQDEAIVVKLSEPLMAWVFENLIKNAVDAMEGKGKITLQYILKDQWVYIDVTDTGRGIPRGDASQYLPPWGDDSSAWVGARSLSGTPYRRGLSPRAHLCQAL